MVSTNRLRALRDAWRSSEGRRALLPTLVLGLGLLAAGALYLWLARNHYFFGDDWDYLLTRGTVAGESLGWLAPHGDHWSTGVVLVNRVLFAMFGLETYLPWSMVAVGFHLVACGLLYGLLVRVHAGRWVALPVVWCLLFYGWGAEAFLWDAAMNLTGSLLLGIAAVTTLARPQAPSVPWPAWLLLVGSLAFSGGGVSAVAMAFVFSALHHDVRSALRVLSVPLATFLLWYVVFGRDGAGGVLDPAHLYLQVPRYVAHGFSDALDHAFVLEGVGAALVVVAVLLPLLPTGAPAALRHLAVAGLAAAVLQLTLAGATRIGFGFDYAGSGRYAYLSLAYLAPSLAIGALLLARTIRAASSRGTVPAWVPAAVAVAVLGAVTLDGVNGSRAYAGGAAAVRGPWEGRLIGTVAAVDAGEAVLTTSTGHDLNKTITPTLITSPEIRAALPDRAATTGERLDAEGMFMVGVGAEPYGQPPATGLESTSFLSAVRDAPGCQVLTSTGLETRISFDSASGAELRVTSPSSSVEVLVVRDGVLGEPRRWDVVPGEPTYVATSVLDAVVVATFDAGGTYQICV